MSIYADIADRAVALQLEAVTGAMARPYFDFPGATFPYWTNRIGPSSYEHDSQDYQTETRRIIMRLVIAHLTGSYEGQSEDVLSDYIEAVKRVFAQHPQLNSDTYPTVPTYTTATGAWIESDTGLQYFQTFLEGIFQVGIEFTLVVELYRETNAE